jgi:heme A synthase
MQTSHVARWPRIVVAYRMVPNPMTSATPISAPRWRIAGLPEIRWDGPARYAWGVVAYNLLVIAWGAFVRATGSGAGCGRHWPLCNGVVVPRDAAAETLIELAHRVTSAFAGVLVIGLLVWVFRARPRGDRARSAAVASLAFILVEGAVGAMLVRLELVAGDASALRAAVLALHLANTFFLLAALTATAWWLGAAPRRDRVPARLRALLGALMVVGMTGAVTALGDTLFPADSLRDGLAQDRDPLAHFLVRLRVWHPALALAAGAVAVWAARAAAPAVARALVAAVALQAALGFVNLLLLAPVWMQLVHLLGADLLWIVAVVGALSPPTPASPPPAPASPAR